MFWLNGYGSKPGSDYLISESKNVIKYFNAVNPMSKSDGFLPGLEFCKLFRGCAEKVFNKKWKDLYGVLNKNGDYNADRKTEKSS